MNILLLNDNPVVTKLVTLSAQKTGNEILIASNLDEITEGSYDLLIVDEALYTPALFDELESKIAYKSSLYMLSRGVASADGFDYEVKKPFLPTDLVELLSKIALHVVKVQEKPKELEIDLDNLDIEDDLDLNTTLSTRAQADDVDGLEDLDFDLDDFDLGTIDLDEELHESDETNSILDQDDVNEVKNLLDETDEDDFSFDDFELDEEIGKDKEKVQDDLTLEEEALQEDLALEESDALAGLQEDMLLDELMQEDFSLDELEDKIETAVSTLSDEDLEQEIDVALDDLGELSTLDEKSLKIALGEEVEELEEELDAMEFEDVALQEDKSDALEDVAQVQSDALSIEGKDDKTDGIEALKTLLKALNNEDVIASLKGMNVSINISFGNSSDK